MGKKEFSMCDFCRDFCEEDPQDYDGIIGYCEEDGGIVGCSDYSTRNPIRFLFYRLWGTPSLRHYLEERREEKLFGYFKGVRYQ